MKKTDKILLYGLGFIILTTLTFSVVKSLVSALFIAFLLLILIRTVLIHVFVRIRKKSVISVTDMETELSIMSGEQCDYFISIAPKAYNPIKLEYGFTYTKKNHVIFVAPNYKFSPTGLDDIARFYRAAKKAGASHVVVLGRYPVRAVLTFAAGFDISFKFVHSKKLHKFLASQNALMPKRKKTISRKKPSFRTLLLSVFSKSHGKYFLLSGLSMSLFAFIGHFRIYYLIFSCICLIFSVLCYTRKT